MIDTVILKWGTSNRKYYLERGYTFTKFGDEFFVKFTDLSPKSHVVIQIPCKHCLKVFDVKFNNLNSSIEEYSCRACKGIDRRTPIEVVRATFLASNLTPLFDKYTSGSGLLKYQCNSHVGIDQFIRYTDLYNGHGCKFCAIEGRAELIRLPIEMVRAAFTARGYIPLFETYSDNQKPLKYLCPKHGEQIISYASLYMGSGCRLCANGRVGDSNRLSLERVISVFTGANYTPLFTKYQNANSPLPYICNKHKLMGVQTTRINDVKQGRGCYYCGVDKSYDSKVKRKANNYKNKDDKTIWKYLRKTTSAWRRAVVRESSGVCCLTGTPNYLHVHHLESYKNLVVSAHSMLGVEIKEMAKEYTTEDLALLEVVMYYLHECKTPKGVIISHKVHKLFHEKYGYTDNTLAQWSDFENNFKITDLNYIETFEDDVDFG